MINFTPSHGGVCNNELEARFYNNNFVNMTVNIIAKEDTGLVE